MSASFVGVVVGCFGSGYTCAGNSSSSLRPALVRSDSARKICHSVYPSLMYPSLLLFSWIFTFFAGGVAFAMKVLVLEDAMVCVMFALKKMATWLSDAWRNGFRMASGVLFGLS